MRSKWFQSLKRFIEQFTPGGTEYTKGGIAIVYSRTGRTTTPRSEYPKIWAQVQEELEKSAQRAKLRRDSEHTH